MKRLLGLGLLLLLSLPLGRITAQDPAEPPTLNVYADQVIGELSPYVYGANYGPLQVVTVDLIDAAIDSGINILRFPGGRWGDLNDIRPQQIDDFIRVCRMIGAEAIIHVRLEHGTPEAAAELVRYTNIEKEYNVRYWSIGNEPNLFDDYTTADHNRDWRIIAEAMLAVDPNILLIGPDTSQFGGNTFTDPHPLDSQGLEWVSEFMRANGDMVDVVAVHRYPFPRTMGAPITSIEDLRGNTPEWSLILPTLRGVIMDATGRDDYAIAVTEANSHWSGSIGGEASLDSHYNAIWWADALGRLLQSLPFSVNFFDMQSFDARGGWGLLNRYDVRPTYYTYQIYKRFGNLLLTAEAPDDEVTIYAAQREDSALTLIVINLQDDEQTRRLGLNGFTPAGAAEVWRLSQELNAEQIADVELSDGVILTLPPQSVTLYILTAPD